MDNVITLVVLIWLLGGFGWLARQYRQAAAALEASAERRHQRQLELARAGAYPGGYSIVRPGADGPSLVPAALGGKCHHPKIVPVITGGDAAAEGDLVGWICANTSCDAAFPPETARLAPGCDQAAS